MNVALTSSADPVEPWRDASRSPGERADALIAEMSLPEKLGQLVGLWVGADADAGEVAPNQDEMTKDLPTFAEAIVDGLGQLTRPFGTAPIDPVMGARSLARSQRAVMAANRFGIPAQVHEECLAGFAAWGATAYPIPLSWGATFDPELVEDMAARIGRAMRSVGVHQGLAPVLDVVRDYRWGRVEETIGEDPHLVATIASAYVHGLESTGVVATLKHFAGYSGSRAGRNHAPVSAGPRELAEVFYPPFEMALREGGARSVMNSYAEVDGVPAAADEARLTGLLREQWGFEGVVVADYFAVAFLRAMHAVATSDAHAAHLALRAGIDVELPSVATYGTPLLEAVSDGTIPEELVDRAVRRVLVQKIELGLLDPDYEPEVAETIDLDRAEQRDLALRLAREAVVLVENDGVLPLAPDASLAVVGPVADDPFAMLGCYSFPAHVGVHHPDRPMGIEVPSVLAELRAPRPGPVSHAVGCDVKEPGRSGFDEAVAAARGADVVVVALGDRAGLFGRGTSGEGCDAPDLHLPGEQEEMLEAILATGARVVLLLLAGRPYALGRFAGRVAAIVQCFFPGQLGARAVADVLTGRVNPSGHLPVQIPREAGAQPGTYLAPPLGRASAVSNLDPDALFAFGHGLSYADLTWGDVTSSGERWPTDGTTTLAVTLGNDTDREVSDVVQVYLQGPAAAVTRPVERLVAFHRVTLAPGERRRVDVELHADLTSFVGLTDRVVEPGRVRLGVARSSRDWHATLELDLVGPSRRVGPDRVLSPTVSCVALG
ncbi:beta-glucosidase family protein [Salana multivorans]|uniref:beta-xylosidase/alpha-l-arabinosidase n=1 Tax=Salana multivorans TaxID=120377 RepID=UPI002490A17C|nr:glycoside hydrolase family 3 N-terminal domain-containing protein [Salana multivorans]